MIFYHLRKALFSRMTCLIILLCFVCSSFNFPSVGYAQAVLTLPDTGKILSLTHEYTPAMVKGITLYPDNPLRFDFIVSKGDSHLQGEELKSEAMKMIKYFLASLTVPEKDLWVNLSPYEKERIIPTEFSQTDMGRDVLAQDFVLKQLTASLIYPENESGKKFWDHVYSAVHAKYGSTDIPVNTFNKVWIVPSKATVYQQANHIFVLESHLKVMVEQDYNALMKNGNTKISEEKDKIYQNILKETVVPLLEKEVNEGKGFAQLRQVFNSLILATWYKQNLKQTILSAAYANKNRINGINLTDKQVKEKIYQQYVNAFRKGVYNYIREELDPYAQKITSRKYVAGGIEGSFAMVAGGIKTVTTVANDQVRNLGQVNGNDTTYNVLLQPIGPKAADIGTITAQANQFLTAAMIANKPSEEKQLQYNQKAARNFYKNFKSIAIEREKPVLAKILSLAGGENATVRRSITTSSEGAPRTTFRDVDGKIKVLDKHGALHVFQFEPQTTVDVVPIPRGKVMHHMTVVVPSELNIDAEALRKALQITGIDVRQMRWTEDSESATVIDKKSVSVKKANGITQIDLNLLYDLGPTVDGAIKEDSPSIIDGLPALQGSRSDHSRVRQPILEGPVKNLFINGAGGRIGSLLIREWLDAGGSESGVKLTLLNGTTAKSIINALTRDSVHGSFLVRDRGREVVGDSIVSGEDNGVEWVDITYKGKNSGKIYITDNRDSIQSLPLAQYGIDIAVDAIEGKTPSTLQEYITAGAKKVINTSPSKTDADGAKVETVLFGVTDLLAKGVDTCSSSSCTTNSVAPFEDVLMTSGGREAEEVRDLENARLQLSGETPKVDGKLPTHTAYVLTVHASTNSDSPVDTNSRPSAMDNGRIETTGASKAIPDLLGLDPKTFSADSLRYPGSNMSLSEVTKVVSVAEGEQITVEDLRRNVREIAKSPRYQGIIDVIEGNFDSKQLLGSTASETILLDSIEVTKVRGTRNQYLVHYKAWYDNEKGFTAKVWNTVKKAADEIDRNQPKAKTIEELIEAVDEFNVKSPVIAIHESRNANQKSVLNVEIKDRQEFTARYGLLDYLEEEAKFNPNLEVRQLAQQIIRQAAHSLNIHSASTQDVQGLVMPFDPGIGSGSNSLAIEQFMVAARDTSAVAVININAPDRRFDKRKAPLAPEYAFLNEAKIPGLEDPEPGYVPATMASVYAAAIRTSGNEGGLVFANLDRIAIDPENFAPYGPFVGLSGMDKIGDPLENAVKDAKARVLEAVKAGVYNFDFDLTPLVKYGEKHADGTITKWSFARQAALELGKFVRSLEDQLGFLSAPMAISFTFDEEIITTSLLEIQMALKNEFKRQELALPVYIGGRSIQSPYLVQNKTLFLINKLAQNPNNLEAQRLRSEMINFMEGLIFLNENLATEKTKRRIAENNLKPGGQRYSRHRDAWLKALATRKQSNKSFQQIFDDILTGEKINSLDPKEQAALDKLVEFAYTAFRNDIFHLRLEEGRGSLEADLNEKAKRDISNAHMQGKRFSVQEIINEPFNLRPGVTLQPKEGRTTLDKYQRFAQANQNSGLKQYREPEFTEAVASLKLDDRGNIASADALLIPQPRMLHRAPIATRAPGVAPRVNSLARSRSFASPFAAPASRVTPMKNPRSESLPASGADEIKTMLDDVFASKSVRFRENIARLYNTGVLGGTRRMVILPIDQGVEHSPGASFAPEPPMAVKEMQIEMAYRLGFNGFAGLAGTIEQIAPKWASKVPLIAKVNMSSSVGGNPKAEMHSARIGNIKELARLGVAAIGFTIYPGSLEQNEQLDELRKVIDEANANDLPVIVWAYPRGGEKLTKAELETAFDVSLSAANMALEAGAAIVKVKPPSDVMMDTKMDKNTVKKFGVHKAEGDPFDHINLSLAERVRQMKALAAWGGTRDLIFSGGNPKNDDEVLKEIAAIAFGGGNGSIIGRNLFQRPPDKALELALHILAIYKTANLMEHGQVRFDNEDQLLEYATRKNQPGDPLYDVREDFYQRNTDWNDFLTKYDRAALKFSSKLEDRARAEEFSAAQTVGGINLDPALIDLQYKRDPNGVPLPFGQQNIETMNIQGVIPFITNEQRVNVLMMLGLNQPINGSNPVKLTKDNTIPLDRQKRLALLN